MNQQGWFLIACAIEVVNRTYFGKLMIENGSDSSRIAGIAIMIFIELHNSSLAIARIIAVVSIKILLNNRCKNCD